MLNAETGEILERTLRDKAIRVNLLDSCWSGGIALPDGREFEALINGWQGPKRCGGQHRSDEGTGARFMDFDLELTPRSDDLVSEKPQTKAR